MAKKDKRPRYTTPIGAARYPYLVRPDTKFNDAGVYRTDLILPEEEAEELVQIIEETLEEATKLDAYKTLAAKMEDDEEFHVHRPYEEDEEGNLIFSFKATASGVNDDGSTWTRNIPIFDAQGDIVNRDLKLGTGSKIRVNFFAKPYAAKFGRGDPEYGCSLKLVAVQLIDLVEWGQDAEQYGFGEVEGGFVADEDSFAEAEAEAPGEDADGASYDF